MAINQTNKQLKINNYLKYNINIINFNYYK